MSAEFGELIGYTDEWAVRPGDEVAVKVSTSAPTYEADLVRLRHGDDRPHAPGLKETIVRTVPVTSHLGRRQFAAIGSFALVPDAPVLAELSSFTVSAWIWPTTPGNGEEQGIVSCLARDESRGWALLVDRAGRAAVKVGSADGPRCLDSGRPLLRRHWYLVCTTYDHTTRTLAVHQLPQPGSLRDYEQAVAVREVGDVLAVVAGGVVIGALSAVPDLPRRTRGTGHYNGKIDAPAILSTAVSASVVERWNAGADDPLPTPSMIAAWDLGHEPASSLVKDRGPHGLGAELINLPARAVTGHTWTGRHHDFRARPQEYSAIHFHADDLEDACWRTDFTLRVPDDLRSGAYAMRLRGDGMVDRVPLFVRPPAGTATAPVAVILPTLTYLAYGNSRVIFKNKEFRESGLIAREVTPDPRDLWLRERPDLGMSLYDVHADGSGSCYASRRRPLIGLRPDFVNWMTGAPRHFGADLYIIDWLEHLGVAYDVVCDEDVHHEGQRLLDRYRVVLTGSHPEYCTEAMLDAYQAYLYNGGRLMYLGGNGFYWATSIDPNRPHVMEVRRGVAGTRPWDSEPGELHHSTTGEPGGLWRHRGRPPNQLVGVGFCAQGWDDKAHAYIVAEPGGELSARVLDGVASGSVVGDEALTTRGAVGDEVDRADPRLGTPPDATVIATANIDSDSYSMAVEDTRSMSPRIVGAHNDWVRADMVMLPSPRAGAVFAASSISFASGLSSNHFTNNLARVATNVLECFASKRHVLTGVGDDRAMVTASDRGST
jgi:N,N-dimethylformamidase